MTGTVPVTGNEIVNVFGVEALRAMVGEAGTSDLMMTVVTGKVFFYFDKVFWHSSTSSL
jgi:hypothetical protein